MSDEPIVRDMTDEELRQHLLRTHHQWHPNKKADAWVSSAVYLLSKLRAAS